MRGLCSRGRRKAGESGESFSRDGTVFNGKTEKLYGQLVSAVAGLKGDIVVSIRDSLLDADGKGFISISPFGCLGCITIAFFTIKIILNLIYGCK